MIPVTRARDREEDLAQQSIGRVWRSKGELRGPRTGHCGACRAKRGQMRRNADRRTNSSSRRTDVLLPGLATAWRRLRKQLSGLGQRQPLGIHSPPEKGTGERLTLARRELSLGGRAWEAVETGDRYCAAARGGWFPEAVLAQRLRRSLTLPSREGERAL